MTGLLNLIRRNSKLFFKDRGMFISALITPMILLVLYATFLAKVYRDSFNANIPPIFDVSDKLINSTVACQLISSLIAVSCVTVAFCCNMVMVQDKVTGARRDLTVSPVKSSVLSLGYYFSTIISTLIVCFLALGAGFVYIASIGWYLSLSDVLFLILDVFLLSMFGTALSSIVNFFASTEGQMSAVGTIISAGYGFICGAYMPISQFGEGLQKVISFFPGTYGTSLIRRHFMRGAFEEMEKVGFPSEVVKGIGDSVDCNIKFFGTEVPEGVMYAVLAGSVVLLLAIYILMNVTAKRKHKA